jgi:hypothetical protein
LNNFVLGENPGSNHETLDQPAENAHVAIPLLSLGSSELFAMRRCGYQRSEPLRRCREPCHRAG